jgi:hypothetical protein
MPCIKNAGLIFMGTIRKTKKDTRSEITEYAHKLRLRQILNILFLENAHKIDITTKTTLNPRYVTFNLVK